MAAFTATNWDLYVKMWKKLSEVKDRLLMISAFASHLYDYNDDEKLSLSDELIRINMEMEYLLELYDKQFEYRPPQESEVTNARP